MLAVVLAALGFLGWREFAPPPTGTPSVTSNPGTSTTGGVATKVLPETVRLESLEPVPVAPEGRRNLFRFGMKPVPPAPPPPVQLPPPPAPAPPRPTGPPPIPLKALGRQVIPVPAGVITDPVTGKPVQQVEHRTIVTLKDPATGLVREAVEGQVVFGRYKLLKIGQQSVEMSYLDGSGYIRIPIGGS